MSFATEIINAAAGEPIQWIAIGDERGDGYGPQPTVTPTPFDDAAIARLDYSYDGGFGGADCHPVRAWTPNRVIFVHEYDGSTCVVWVPRNPTAGAPGFSGQEVPPDA